MLHLAEKYKRSVEDVHLIFFQVSCDRDQLVKVLEGQKAQQWTILEDLALKDHPSSTQYEHVLATRGSNQLAQRVRFLELM